MQRTNQFLSACFLCLLVFAASLVAPADALRSGVNCRALANPISIASKQCLCQPCQVCAFSWTNWRCQLIVNSDTDVSDGSNIKTQQPTTDASAWFLTQAELTASRNGVPRNDLSVYTTGNDVSTFAACDELFNSVIKDVEATGANDSIYLAAWSTDEIPFDPTTDVTGAKTGFKALFNRAITRGADFRALVWTNLIEVAQNIRIRDYFNALTVPSKVLATTNARFVFDDRLPIASSSHHQKTLVVRKASRLTAYVGGIDLTSDRWDTLRHNSSVLRKLAHVFRRSDGWIDAHLRIDGPASLDVGANFLARWNSPTKPTQDLLDSLLQFENPSYSALPSLNSFGSLDTTSTGSSSVQIARTFSCKYKKYDFAPQGERSILNARLKAIRMAKNYIYIEDQYFIDVPELRAALLEVLPRIQRLIVVVQRTGLETKITGYEKYFYDMVAPIQQRFPNKLQLYSIKKSKNLYLHSKLVVIDDVYLSIGSSNWNRRSMTSDSEIGANVVDTNLIHDSKDGILVNKVARDFRVRKFMEHTGKSYAEVDAMSFLDAANALDVATKDANAILDVLELEQKALFAAVTDGMHDLADPDDTC